MFALVENECDFGLLCNSTEKARKQKTRKERNERLCSSKSMADYLITLRRIICFVIRVEH